MSLELKRKEVELMRVRIAKSEMELRVAERQDEIQRLEENIKIQVAAEERLLAELKTLKGE
jgi:hypothetical protein